MGNVLTLYTSHSHISYFSEHLILWLLSTCAQQIFLKLKYVRMNKISLICDLKWFCRNQILLQIKITTLLKPTKEKIVGDFVFLIYVIIKKCKLIPSKYLWIHDVYFLCGTIVWIMSYMCVSHFSGLYG